MSVFIFKSYTLFRFINVWKKGYYLRKIAGFLFEHKIKVIILYTAILIVSLLLMPLVRVNYDLSKYLPKNSNTQKAIDILEEEFHNPGNAEIIVENVAINRGMTIKELIKSIEGVSNVLWLDDFTDIAQPQEYMEASVRDQWYKDGNALYMVEFNDGNYGKLTSSAIKTIISSISETTIIRGVAADSYRIQNVLNREIFGIFLIIIILCILILILNSSSWIEHFLYLTVLGVSVIINSGTNAFFDNISFITQGISAVLQLAISMGYTFLLLHSFNEEKEKESDIKKVILKAMTNTISTIFVCSLTAIAGFLALTTMKYGIGTDIGLVLAKGIIINFICVITLMPVLLLLTHNQQVKTKHKNILPSFKRFSKLTIKYRFIIIILVLILIIPALMAQKNISFIYGDSSNIGDGQAAEQQKISNTFGIYNPIILIVKAGDILSENDLTSELEKLPSLHSVQGLGTMASDGIPQEFLPEADSNRFVSENYNKIIVNLNIEGENDLVFKAVNDINILTESYYKTGEWYSVGIPTIISDIKSTVSHDNLTVYMFSIIFIGIIILIFFRSFSLPIIMILVIQFSMLINMSISYFTGSKLTYIGYIIISALQLGTTINYAILIIKRYLVFRSFQTTKTAVYMAIKTGGSSVLFSALILTITGIAIGFLSKISSIRDIGFLIGRGAFISGIMVLVLLPPLLFICDPLIKFTTLGIKKKEIPKVEIIEDEDEKGHRYKK